METWVIEVTEFNSEVRCHLRGRLEAAMASEATKMAVRGNMDGPISFRKREDIVLIRHTFSFTLIHLFDS